MLRSKPLAWVRRGDGFFSDPAFIASHGVSDPNRFFQTLLTKPYLGNVVISPHYYPPSISQASSGCAHPRSGGMSNLTVSA